mgnify:CR=1 FL=1
MRSHVSRVRYQVGAAGRGVSWSYDGAFACSRWNPEVKRGKARWIFLFAFCVGFQCILDDFASASLAVCAVGAACRRCSSLCSFGVWWLCDCLIGVGGVLLLSVFVCGCVCMAYRGRTVGWCCLVRARGHVCCALSCRMRVQQSKKVKLCGWCLRAVQDFSCFIARVRACWFTRFLLVDRVRPWLVLGGGSASWRL